MTINPRDVVVTVGSLSGERALSVCDQISARRVSREASTLVLRLGQVDTIDASGVAALVRLHSRLARMGKSLHLVGVQPPVNETLRRLALDELMTIEPAVTEDVWPRRLATTQA